MLSLKDVSVYYGSAVAVTGITLSQEEGTVVSVIGANGAGKSTMLKAITGLVPIQSGSIEFDGRRIDGSSTDAIVKAGIACVPESRKLFPYMSVHSNLKLGAYLRKDKQAIGEDLEGVFALFPRLKERLRQKAGSLSGGEQQMLAIGRALMSKPRLLMMDEPSLGLAPIVIDNLAENINEINRRGVSVLLIEQNAGLVSRVAQRCYVIEVGRIVLEGNINEMMSNDSVRRAFLG
ncbi:MAG: ABC transporter ATP-binding protein [Thermoleophilia bacterium]|nr:ABC transporter ATP-binding protein [Thermoleophilia bacterium]